MEKNLKDYIFSTSTRDVISENDFNVEIYEFNSENGCEDSPYRQIKNFEELISFLEEWEDEKSM